MRRFRRAAVYVTAAIVATSLSVTPGTATAAAPRAQTPAPVPAPQVATRPFVVSEPREAATDHTDPAWLDAQVTVPPEASVEVDVPASGWAPAGSLPVAVARSASGTVPGKVRVRMLSQEHVRALGGRFIAFELLRADGGAAAGSVAVAVDYTGIAKAYGGDFASRLRLVPVVPCPAETVCARPELGAVNEGAASRIRAATVAVGPDPAVAPLAPAPDSGFGPQPTDADDVQSLGTSTTSYTLTSTTSGANGDYTASQLSAADTWNVGVGSGAFTYSYPVGVPPAVAGAAPSLSLNYNSQSVDGRTSASNGQVSKVGEGWGFEPGFIERRFHSCRDEGVARDDFCWSGANEYFISFMGQSGELVRTGTSSNQWRIRGNDPAWQILSFTACCSNGDNDGEYFVVITPGGTKYWFGYGIEPRNTTTRPTHSAWTVPVYGNTSGEPCYKAVTAESSCQQAYRWNVDRILDTNDNVTSFFYAKETNKYSRQGLTSLPTEYTRSGYLTSIEYSQRNGNEGGTAFTRVRVTTTERCKTIKDDNCTTAATASSSPSDFPDVPLDLMCTGLTCTSAQTKPTFWSTKAVKRIYTEFWNAELSPAAYDPVATYELKYSFPPTGDSSSPSLWLTDIYRTGEYGVGSITPPATRMAGTLKPNRVNTSVNEPLYKYRVASISTELGARVDVTYATPDPCPVDTVFAADTNPYDCYPVWYDGGWIPFHKYVVTDVDTFDVRGGQPARNTHYEYVGAPAWHYADSTLAAVSTLPSTQTWNDWRGYEAVRVRTDNDTATTGSSDSDTRYLVFRGMYGDKLAGGGAKTQAVTDSLGAVFTDYDYRGGQVLEAKTMHATSGAHLSSLIYRYWSYQTVNGPNGFQSHDADYVRPSRSVNRVKNTATGAWRNHIVDYEYSATTGLRTSVSDDEDPDDADDNTCVKTWYTLNSVVGTSGGTSEWIVDRPYKTLSYSDPCGTGTTAVQVGQSDVYYDGHKALTDPPADGNPTTVVAYAAAGVTATTVTTYDDHGRVTSVKAPAQVALETAGKTTRTAYAPTSGYPYQGITVTDPSDIVRRTVLYSAFGSPRRVIDVSNDDTTLVTVDPLGRTTAVIEPGNPAGMPGLEFEYRVEVGLPNRVTTRTLTTDTAYVGSFEYFDGLGRSVQTQYQKANDADSGRRVAVTRYDPLGHVIAGSAMFSTGGVPGSDMVDVALADIPRETRTGYDSAGRVYIQTQYAYGVAKISHRTDHTGWGYTVDAPVHSDVDYATDVVGRVTSVVERPATGTITTTYRYTPTGQLDTITDAGTNVTDYDYDWLGRRTQSVDPDQGTWNTTYTADGDVASVTDANLTGGVRDKVVYAYDASRRKTHVYAGSAAPANLLAQWTYGSPSSAVLNAKGRLVSATSYDDGTAYTVSITGYDNRGRVNGKKWDVPGFGTSATEDDTYTYTYGYAQDDSLETVSLPAAGGLPAETVTTVRNGSGLPVRLTTSLDWAAPYVASTAYLHDGAVASRSLVGGVTRSYTFDSVGRLSTASGTAPLTSAAGAAGAIEDVTYTYDGDSNVVAVRDGLAGGVQRECFEYDPLNRLTRAYTNGTTCSDPPSPTSGADPYDLAYAYDDLGNITSATDGGVVTAYDYAGTAHPHAPVSVGGGAYTYDGNGATITRPAGTATQTLTWTRLHQLKEVTGPGASSFVYDADGSRLLRTTGDTTTLYLDGMELESTGGTTSATVTAKRYYGGMAMRTPAGVRVLLHNRQNSTSVAYDPATDTAAYQRYQPYGARRGTTALAATERRFLDKTEDDTGLIAMGARYYDPKIARFISVDPLSDLARPQTLATYSYSLGNPATLSDPTGLAADDTSGGGPGCENDCADPEILHQIRFDYATDKINAGEAPEDEVMRAGNFSPQEWNQLWWGMSASPCSIAGDRSSCAGNSHYIFICQMSGESRCAARAADAASAGEFLAGGVLTAAGSTSKVANAVGARFRGRGSSGTGRPRLGQLVRNRLGNLNDTGALGSRSDLLTNAQAADLAKWSGFRPAGSWRIRGQRVFTDGRRYIVQDVDGHIRTSMWKMAQTPRDLLSKTTRMGTYDYEFNELGP